MIIYWFRTSGVKKPPHNVKFSLVHILLHENTLSAVFDMSDSSWFLLGLGLRSIFQLL